MEVGQHPRDILRRRVRTAEYYRILPDKNNSKREFEFYNEERDTWFTLTFQDLLRYARYPHDNGSEGNPAAIDRIFNSLSKLPTDQGAHDPSSQRGGQFTLAREASGTRGKFLGAKNQTGDLTREEEALFVDMEAILNATEERRLVISMFTSPGADIDQKKNWYFSFLRFDLGVKHVYPKGNRVWTAWEDLLKRKNTGLLSKFPREYLKQSLAINPRLGKAASKNIYHSLKNVALNDPFQPGTLAVPRTPEWFAAFAFYVEVYNRSGTPLGYFEDNQIDLREVGIQPQLAPGQYEDLVQGLRLREAVPKKEMIDITAQLLQHLGARGSVNHPAFLRIRGQAFHDNLDNDDNSASNWASRFLLTYEILGPLLREYKQPGGVVTGIEYLRSMAASRSDRFSQLMGPVFDIEMYNSDSVIDNTLDIYPPLKACIDAMLSQLTPADPDVIDAVYLARNSIHTWPMNLTTTSHVFHPRVGDEDAMQYFRDNRATTNSSYSHLNTELLDQMASSGFLNQVNAGAISHYWFHRNLLRTTRANPPEPDKILDIADFWNTIGERLTADPVAIVDVFTGTYIDNMPRCARDIQILQDLERSQRDASQAGTLVYRIANTGLETVSIDMNQPFHTDDDPPPLTPAQTHVKADLDHLQDVEIVIVRPNIEHNMLGVIMGLGGDSLGNTLWGQTELSVYDDSMHGIWGMSYKYHERAIVFNEKNLIRLWDIAYDGYNGGKDDTYVDWIHQDAPNGVLRFQELTLDVSKNYRGPSMMVMAFVHDRERRDTEGSSLFDKNFKRNWPSPIVFHDNQTHASHNTKETLPVDYDNLQVIDVEEFRVFNNPLYNSSYTDYRNLMPHFHEMHMMRKTAGQSSADSETHTDSLAFQGSMRIKENGIIVQEIHGSGHHGPDYTGVASVRAGKGQKTAGQAPTLHRLI
jgi:hypothetical protein